MLTKTINTAQVVPSWMNRPQATHYLRFRSQFAKGLPKGALAPEEAETLARLRWVRRNHSANNPRRPEFPFFAPRFPASRAYPVQIPLLDGYDVLVKDESTNPSGTHKARLAWEVLLLHMNMLEQKLAGRIKSVPGMSIISSGSTALALADTFNAFGAPCPNVLCSDTAPESLIAQMQAHGIQVHPERLGRRAFNSDEILRLTDNEGGIDLTGGRFAIELSRNYYDWLSFEAMNLAPSVVIVPYGTGQLFDNLLLHLGAEVREVNGNDPRFAGDRDGLSRLSVIWVSAGASSIASKLAAPFLPGSTKDDCIPRNNLVSQLVKGGIIGRLSRIYEIPDWQLLDTMRLAEEIGLNAEISALAGLAWLIHNRGLIPKESRIVVVNTGNSGTED